MKLTMTRAVIRQLDAIPKADASRLLAALEQIVAEPKTRFSFVTEMVGQPGAWRLRKGDWRATDTIEGDEIVVKRIGHRKDIY